MNSPLETAELIARIEAVAPPQAAAPWDKSGVQIAGTRPQVRHLAVCLDPSPERVQKALSLGADFILAHHPLSRTPQFLDQRNDFHATAAAVLSAGAWLYSAHTSLDANPRGPSAWLAAELNLQNTRVLEATFSSRPVTYCIRGAQAPAPEWRQLPGIMASRVQGNDLVLSCAAGDWPAIEAALSAGPNRPVCLPASPELPAIVFGFGLVGDLPEALPLEACLERLGGLVRAGAPSLSGPRPKTVRRLAVCGGSGSPLAASAFALGADLLVTGDVKYHTALESAGCLLDVGHFSLEEEMMRRFAAHLQSALPGLAVAFLPGEDPFVPAVFPIRNLCPEPRGSH